MEITAERAFVSAIGGSCTSPVAAYAETFGSQITIRVMAGLANGTKICSIEPHSTTLEDVFLTETEGENKK